MSHKQTHQQWFCRLGLLLVCLAGPVALASNTDTQEPIHIEADSAKIDEQKGMMTYSGHVLLRQGGIEVRADTVVVYTEEGELRRITAQGTPVSYLQKASEPEQTPVKGVSQRMDYDASSKQVLLLGEAEFWQAGNRFSGNRIQYDPRTESVVANAGTDAGDDENGTTSSGKRVTVTLQPRKSGSKAGSQPEPQSSPQPGPE